jgi:hypothetical protein
VLEVDGMKNKMTMENVVFVVMVLDVATQEKKPR